jgi:FlaA1/EpsC-like NDP-sugar epimerase
MGADLGMGLLTYLLAVSIRFDWDWPHATYLWQTSLIIALVRPALSIYFGVYQGITTYFGRWDLVALAKAVSVGSLAVAALTYFAGWQSHPRSVFVIDWALLMFFMAGSRYALRAWSRRHPRARWQMRERALIVGAGTGGEQISRALLEDPSAGYKPIGFIDESQDRWGSRIHGVKVLGGAAELPLAISANDVRTVFVCLSDLTETSVREVADICAGAQVECRMLPALSELLSTDPFAADRNGSASSTAPRSAAVRS